VDEQEPLENVQVITAANVEVHIYPGVGHWFFEEDRPSHYDTDAAVLAWRRTLVSLGAP
jgi:dienelactone hydrolase